jgi:hypothetical protein
MVAMSLSTKKILPDPSLIAAGVVAIGLWRTSSLNNSLHEVSGGTLVVDLFGIKPNGYIRGGHKQQS